ncbi:MAG: hypothetical protein A2X11_00780 [Bacteroidetes bacterium GWE2_42_24]|nr:MAG: hypothetical protein A2X11_00780 [Bacteroidetes bacterium GWE2_42_24]OFY27500.1 MAG: hypothetical protein A2X09_07445 [Bacteroidetes bacterium GWF2_43_11]
MAAIGEASQPQTFQQKFQYPIYWLFRIKKLIESGVFTVGLRLFLTCDGHPNRNSGNGTELIKKKTSVTLSISKNDRPLPQPRENRRSFAKFM